MSTMARHTRAVLCAVTLLVTGVASAQSDGFRLEGLSGDSLQRADLADGDTVVVVWASWSPRCRDIAERVAALERRWGAQSRILTVNFQEDAAAARAVAAAMSARTYLDRDGVFAKQHAVATLPALVVYRGGQVAYQGRLPDAPDDLLAQIFD